MSVFVNGTKRKVLGLENMDQITIEAKKIDKLGDTVHIFGDKRHNGQFYTIHDFSKNSNTTPSNIITHMSERVNKIYI